MVSNRSLRLCPVRDVFPDIRLGKSPSPTSHRILAQLCRCVADLISHTTLVGMTLISHTTLVGMTLILVSFFILILILLIIILATKASSI